MPAKRLPWIKFWPELLEHRKFGELSDSESWTWIVVWGKASQQPERWKFASIDHASRATGRPRKQILRLIEVHLIDQAFDGRLTIHDVKQWQERYPSDDLPDGPGGGCEHLNGHAQNHSEVSLNTPSKLVESHANAASTLRQDSDSSYIQKGEERREINTPLTPLGGQKRPRKPAVERKPISDADVEELVGKYAERYGNRQSVRDEIDQALNHQARFKSVSERLYVDGWLRRELAHRPGWHVVPGRQQPAPTRAPLDRTGVAN